MEGYTTLSFFKEIEILLRNDFPSEEIKSLQRIIFEKKLGLPIHKVYLNPSEPVSDSVVKEIQQIISELKIQKPIQYLLGESHFFGLKFLVTPDVLIPRPETEELVDWIVKENYNQAISILDIGTGSGCIAISLAHSLSKAFVMAIDISDKAIEMAQRNAIKNNVKVQFKRCDILNCSHEIESASLDVIVSNPPYVRESEKALMRPNVLNWEPHLALFVSDSDPLIFYRAIAKFSKNVLKPNGKVFCEINEALGKEVKNLYAEQGFIDVEIRKDLNGKDRMLKAILGDGKRY